MRAVHADLAAAILAPERTSRVRLSCDWDGDGHGPVGSIDDLSGQAAGVKVSSVLQGTLPDQVSVVEGTGAATIDVDLAKGDTADERLQAVRYFSVAAPDSPLAGKPRLARDLRADVEFLTDSGWQSAPLLRGVSQGLPVRVASRSAQLSGLDHRDRLRTPVALPAMTADPPARLGLFETKPGMESTWVASYVLWRCGYPVSPPPLPQCRLWVPMHGSALAFIAAPFMGSRGARTEDPATGANSVVEFGPGPFAGATLRQPTGRSLAIHQQFAAGAPMFTANGRSSGRIEMWIQPSSADWLSGTSITIFTFSTILCQVTYGVDLTGSSLALTNDATTRVVLGPAVPDDGGWHKVGVQWDDAAGQATFNLDGALTAAAFTPTPANAGGTDADAVIDIAAVPPMAELQVTTGIPFSTPWQPTVYSPPALLDPLQNKLDGIVPGDPVEGWTILQELTAAEQGAVWLDPDGRPHVASRARLVSTAAQVPQRSVEATADLLDLAYDLALSRVANIVTAPYQPIAVSSQTAAWKLSETIALGALEAVALQVAVALATSQRSLFGHANSSADGTGTQYALGNVTPGPVTASVEYVSDTAAVVTIVNSLSVPVWLVDSTGQPDLAISGDVISQAAGANPAVVTNDVSRDRWGDRPLSMPDSRWTQRREFGWGMAMATAGDLADPQPVFTELPIPGDPRLEFFDRLTLDDPDNTGLVMDVWYVGGEHAIDATGQYVQRLVARPARNQFLAGVGLAGVDLVG